MKIEITGELLNRLSAYADKQHITIETAINQILKDFLDKNNIQYVPKNTKPPKAKAFKRTF